MTASYRITSRENYDGNLPMAVVFCDSKGMLRDRVVSLREANIYNPHYARHLVTNIRVLAEENEVYHVHSSYQVTQTSLDGETRIFSVGRYLDRIVMDGDGPRFKERSVIADTGAIQKPAGRTALANRPEQARSPLYRRAGKPHFFAAQHGALCYTAAVCCNWVSNVRALPCRSRFSSPRFTGRQ